MSLHRLLTDTELAGDLLVRVAFGNEPEHGSFAFSERLWIPWNLDLTNQASGRLRR